jgi:hypothetical protein
LIEEHLLLGEYLIIDFLQITVTDEVEGAHMFLKIDPYRD